MSAVLFDDIVEVYRDAVRAFYDLGCRYLQFDDTSWGEFRDPAKREAYAAEGIDVDQVAKNYVDVINRILEAKPADMTITTHICRGNFRSTWFSSGGYEPVAEVLFGGANYDGFFLEDTIPTAPAISPRWRISATRRWYWAWSRPSSPSWRTKTT